MSHQDRLSRWDNGALMGAGPPESRDERSGPKPRNGMVRGNRQLDTAVVGGDLSPTPFTAITW